jgi:hypothetical protein
VDFEAFRKRGYSAFDFPPGPHANNPVETKSFGYIDAADSSVGVCAAQKSGMKHVGQAYVADVHAVSSDETTRFIWLYAAADESG